MNDYLEIVVECFYIFKYSNQHNSGDIIRYAVAVINRTVSKVMIFPSLWNLINSLLYSPRWNLQDDGDFADDLFIGFPKIKPQFLSLIQISLTDLMKSRTRIFITNIDNVSRVCTQIRSYPLHKKIIGSVWENGGWFSTLYMTKRCCIYLY